MVQYGSRIPSSNITTQGTFGTFSHTLTKKQGSTSVSSNSNYFGLGGLSRVVFPSFKVRVTQSFSDNYSDSTPDENSTFTTSSKWSMNKTHLELQMDWY